MGRLSPDAALKLAKRLTQTNPRVERERIESLLDDASRSEALCGAVLLSRGNLYFTLGEYGRVLQVAAELAGREPTAGVGHNLRGVVHLERGEWTDALEAFEEALRTLPESDTVRRANVHNNLALLCWRLGELVLAAEHFKKAAAAFVAGGRPLSVGNTKNNLGMVLEEQGDSAGARALFEEAAEILADSPGYRSNVLANLAGLDEADGHFDKAEQHLHTVLAIREGMSLRRGIAGTCLGLARLSLAQGKDDVAASWLSRGRDEAEALGLKKHLADVAALEAELLAARGQWEAAYAARVRFEELQGALNREDLQRRVEASFNRAGLLEARREAERRCREASALRAAKETAEAALRTRSAFLATTSHELRGPLTVVLSMCHLLAETVSAPAQREHAALALEAAQTLTHVVDDVLDLSRLESGVIQISPAPFELRALVSQVTRMLEHIRPRSEVAVLSCVAEDVPLVVEGDVDRIRQVLMNLMTNASRYTVRGRVVLEVDTDAEGICFLVHDTGVGIPDEQIPELFEPFSRGQSRFVQSQGGTGLGLSISRRLAEALSGRLELVSTSSAGTTFSLWLPLADTEQAPQQPEQAPVQGGALRDVLVVEDDPAVQRSIVRLLRWLGHSATSAGSCADARRAMGAGRFDVVLLDLRLPDASGLDLSVEILRIPDPPRVVIISGEISHESRRLALDNGVSHVLSKPFTMTELQTVLA